jgi:hypothetical protein
MIRTFYAMLIPSLLLGGCAGTSLVDEDLGKAQAQMIRNQVYNPSTLQGPQDKPVEGIDPDSAKAAIDAMRKDVPDRSSAKRDMAVTLGAQQGQSGSP